MKMDYLLLLWFLVSFGQIHFVLSRKFSSVSSLIFSFEPEPGYIYTWGDNSFGECGDGTTIQPSSPVMITTIFDIIQIESGGNFTLAILGILIDFINFE